MPLWTYPTAMAHATRLIAVIALCLLEHWVHGTGAVGCCSRSVNPGQISSATRNLIRVSRTDSVGQGDRRTREVPGAAQRPQHAR